MTEPLILHVDSSKKSQAARTLFKGNDRFQDNFFIKEKTSVKTDQLTVYPSLQYGDKMISGIDGVIEVISKTAQLESLEDIFGFKKSYKTENSRLRDREKIALALGFVLGGTYIHLISNAFQVTTFIGIIIALTIPIILTLAWPYMWPHIKKELRKIRLKSFSEMDKDNEV